MNLGRSKINALLALALFTFAFLAAEFRFDVNVGLLAGAERVVIAQGFILGASVLGFIGYAPLLGLARRKGHSLDVYKRQLCGCGMFALITPPGVSGASCCLGAAVF